MHGFYPLNPNPGQELVIFSESGSVSAEGEIVSDFEVKVESVIVPEPARDPG